MKTLIVETVTAPDTASLRQRRDAVTEADLVELRLDGVADLDVAGALNDRRRPVVVTCRPLWEGGRFDGAEDTRRRIINEAAALGAEFVDVERRAAWRPETRPERTGLVLSDHDFTGIPADLRSRVAAMRREGAAVIKVAAMPRSASDCLTLRDEAVGDGVMVVIGMGPFGAMTRILPERFGSHWTYCGQAAPGQLTAPALVHGFRVREITSAAQLFAVTGRPLAHSASPAMHNAAFRAMGLDAVYVPLEAASVEDADRVATALGVIGLSVTAPLKAGWNVTLDDEASRALCTVNTLKRGEDGWLGRNVDGDGFLDPLDARGIGLTGRRSAVLGAGGAARAVARALVSRGSEVSICARRPDEAERLAAVVGAAPAGWPLRGEWDVVVNATPVGTWPDVVAAPLDMRGLRAGLVYDLVYYPEETALMAQARRAGASVIGGLEMLVGQAIRQNAWWTGQAPPAGIMAAAARAWISTDRNKVSNETDDV